MTVPAPIVFPLLLALLFAVPGSARTLPKKPDDAAKPIEFARDVKPIFTKHCITCHGPDKQKNGLRLDRRVDALRGGDGGRVIVPGNRPRASSSNW